MGQQPDRLDRAVLSKQTSCGTGPPMSEASAGIQVFDWGVVQFVGTGLSLAAVVVLAVFYGFNQFISTREREFKSLPEPDRIKLARIEAKRRGITVDVSKLGEAYVYDLGKTTLALQGQRQWQILIGSCVAALLLTGIVLSAIWTSRPASVPADQLKSSVEISTSAHDPAEYIWIAAGSGDCQGRDTSSTPGESPDPAICTADIAGKLTAVCWGHQENQNSDTWCTYKVIPTEFCSGGGHPGALYACEKR